MSDLSEILRCPSCRGKITAEHACASCGERFLVVQNQPVLVDFSQSILKRESFADRGGASPIQRSAMGFRHRVHKAILGDNRVAEPFARRMVNELRGGRVLVVGGGSIGRGAEPLYAGSGVDVVGTDIYASPHTRVVADGHSLPFADGSFDGVWVQAVMEHVLDPWRVASEIHRVLRPDGLLYAETPFMQQVHEGAYDFTRFTLSGHRWLFRNFDAIDSGVTAGAGTALRWSVQYAIRAATGSTKLGNWARWPFFWVRFLDGTSRFQAEAASCVYFFGRRSETPINPSQIVEYFHSRRR